MTVKEYVIASAVTCVMIYMTATITDRRHAQHEQTAIQNAIAHCQEPRDCDSQRVIDTIRSMSDNGQTMSWYNVCYSKREER
jgi:hypothetical protein